MDKEKVLDYVMNSPGNSNRAVLSGMLDEYSGGSGESWSTLFEGEVTTENQDGICGALLSASDYIDADKIKVTFNSVEYVCNKTAMDDGGDIGNIYGGSLHEESEYDFSNYPFVIESWPDGTYLDTESPGTYSIKIEIPQESGSSGDWSTAEVTFINYTVISDTVRCATIYLDSLCIDTVTIPRANDKKIPPYGIITCLIPLYKNQYRLSSLDFSEDFSDTLITTTGNIVEDENDYLITGDCTITFNAGESAPVDPAH